MVQRARSRARGWALQVLYAWDARGRGEPVEGVLEDFLTRRRIASLSRPYLRELVESVAGHREELDEKVQDALTNWRLERLSAIDRNILRLGAAELLYAADVPPRVAIHEAISLAEKYGTTESPRFVNGVLDALMRRSGLEDDGEGREERP